MENTARLLRLVHKVALSSLLLLMVTIPLIIDIDIMTAFVILPTLLCLIFTLSIVIDQKLSQLAFNNRPFKNKDRCSFINCLHKKCLG